MSEEGILEQRRKKRSKEARRHASPRAGRGVSQSAGPERDDSTPACALAGRPAMHGDTRRLFLALALWFLPPRIIAPLNSCNVMCLGMDVFIKKVQQRRIHEKYSLHRKIGEGGFGAVYSGQSIAAPARFGVLTCPRQRRRYRRRNCVEAGTQVNCAIHIRRGGRQIRPLSRCGRIPYGILVRLA